MYLLNNKFKTLSALLLAVFLFSNAGCDGILEVEDPGSIEEDELDDPRNETLMMNGVRGQFQYTHAYSTPWTGQIADELVMEHTFVDYRPIAMRTADETNIITENMFNFWTKSVMHAKHAVENLENFHGEAEAWETHNMQKALTYGGHSLIRYAESFCEGTIDVGEPKSSDELFEKAVDYFEDALQVAGNIDATDDVIAFENLSNLGMARAKLNLGEFDEAQQYASLVPEDFEMWLRYSYNSPREELWFYEQTTSGRYISPAPKFRHLDDPRITHTEEAVVNATTGNETTYQPFQPLNFDDFDPEAENVIEDFTDVRFASGLEARYIEAEALLQGEGDEATAQDLVNERRDFGGQEQADYSGDELLEELLDQKGRDFFLTNNRLGDIRRFLNLYGIDKFPEGEHPIYGEPYGDVTCFPIPESEINANPNL